MSLHGRHIVLGVCGGVAAYKAVDLCRRLVEAGAYVSPILTHNATRFIGAATFAAVASEPPRISLWDGPEPSPHTTLGKRADLIIVAPATARLLACYATGASDDLLVTTLLATRAPVLLCPAMHTEMWEHPAVRNNIDVLRGRAVSFVDPENGALAGGDHGLGRLAATERIVTAATDLLATDLLATDLLAGLPAPQTLSGKHFLITAGGTREPLDPVRFLGNRSSGKQGHSLAAQAAAQGADVQLVTTSSLPVPPGSGIKVVNVETAQQLHDTVLALLPAADVVIMAAAVADFRPTEPATKKLKKADGPPQITLEPTPDVLAAIVARRRPGQIIVGFAAETTDVLANAQAKLQAKQLDLIVANDVGEPGAGFEHDTNNVTILDQQGRKSTTGLVDKRTVSVTVLDRVTSLLSDKACSVNSIHT